MIDLFQELNEAQRTAVTTTEGVVRVIAGAGSGKTRTLAHRFAYLVTYGGIMPGHILCVTFTNKAAGEMRARIHNLTGDNDTGYINTFHGFCVSVLQEDSHVVSYPKSFLVLDNSDINQMLGMIYEERGLTLSDMTYCNARDMIEIRKLFREPEYYNDMIDMSLDELRHKYYASTDPADIIFYGYLYQEKKCFALDYNDLIKFTLYIFSHDRDVKHKWQQRLEYIMIDEFQDIDSLQYELMRVLCGYHRNLFIVGDPDQTIYTWRGASTKYLLDFDRDFPETQTVMMTANYRSTPQIISTVNSLIAKNNDRIKKDLVPVLADGDKPLCHYAENPRAEIEWITDSILKLHESGTPYRDIAVLYRAHYITRNLEEVFIDRKIPYNIYSGVQFFDRAEIKDALAYLRLIALRDDLSFMRVVNIPKRNIGKTRLAAIKAFAEANGCLLYEALRALQDTDEFRGTGAGAFIRLIDRYAYITPGMPVSELLSVIMNDSGYEKMLRTEGNQERLDGLAELKQSIHDFELSCGEECTLPYYLAHIAMFTSGDASEMSDKVRLMTVHAAKGLEFSVVFVCAMSEGIFPTRRTMTLPAMEEERRLAFVAMTRAERLLFLSTSEGRNFDGSPRYPSRFLLDIDKELLDFTHEPNETLINDACRNIEFTDKFLCLDPQGSLLQIGDRVNHVIFGPGTIVEIDTPGNAYMVEFDSLDTPRTILWRTRLERIL